MSKAESKLWFAGWRPVSEKWPRFTWIDPESGARYSKDRAIKIQANRGDQEGHKP